MKSRNTPKVSIIVPVYNVEKYIRQCLDSLMMQTLQDIEIILINDCSTDTSAIICDEYAAKDNRFIVIHNEINIRQGLSRNKGIEKAKGEYVGFVDADDWIDTDYYEKLYNAAISNQSEIAKTEVVLVHIDGSYESQPQLNIDIQKGLKKSMPIFLLFNYEHWTAIFRRDLLIKFSIRYPDIRNAQDDVFLLRFNYHASSIALISNTHYYYRQHPVSTIAVREKPFYESILHCFDLKLEFLNTHEMNKEYYIIAFQYVLNMVYLFYEEINKKTNLNYFKIEYLRQALMIIKKNKYKEDILNCFNWGFQGEEMVYLQLKKSVSYKIVFLYSRLKSGLFKFLNSLF